MNRKEVVEDLLNHFKQSLIENGEQDTAILIPFVGEVDHYRGETFDNKDIQLFSIVAHLLNMVEVKGQVQDRRIKELPDLRNVEGLFAGTIQAMLDQEFTEEDILNTLRRL